MNCSVSGERLSARQTAPNSTGGGNQSARAPKEDPCGWMGRNCSSPCLPIYSRAMKPTCASPARGIAICFWSLRAVLFGSPARLRGEPGFRLLVRDEHAILHGHTVSKGEEEVGRALLVRFQSAHEKSRPGVSLDWLGFCDSLGNGFEVAITQAA